jgi:chorismate synthase
MAGKTTGGPLTLQIENSDHTRWKGKDIEAMTAPRPGHADLNGAVKFGYTDLRPSLERASARETAARVAGGAVCRLFLAQFGIRVEGYVFSIGEVTASLDGIPFEERASEAHKNEVCCPDQQAAEKMQNRIRQAMDEKDTVGGVIEVLAFGLPTGLGTFTQWDRRLDARLGAAILSVQAIKGVEFGPAFENTRLPGTQVHDAIELKGQSLVRFTNRAGGLEGGTTTGQPLWIRAAMKPIPTTLNSQQTVDLASGQPSETRYERSDFCPTPRAVVVLEAMTCVVLADALIEKLGGDSLEEQKQRFITLKQPRLPDLPVQGGSIIFW